MANQRSADKKVRTFMLHKADYDQLEQCAKSMGYPASVLFQEAAYRLSKAIRNKTLGPLRQGPRKTNNHSKPISKRACVGFDIAVYAQLEKHARNMGGITPSILLREGVYRLLEDICNNKPLILERVVRDNEGYQ